jgi:hypothetical protein
MISALRHNPSVWCAIAANGKFRFFNIFLAKAVFHLRTLSAVEHDSTICFSLRYFNFNVLLSMHLIGSLLSPVKISFYEIISFCYY